MSIDEAKLETLREKFQVQHEVVKAARETLDRNIWDYLRGGTETETTVKRNRLALDKLAFRPRVLRNVHDASPAGPALGKDLRLPVILAPIGGLDSFDPTGGAAVMRAACGFGCGLMLSSVAKVPLEDAAAARFGDAALRTTMLYKRGDDGDLDEYVKRSIDNGYEAFCLTVDSAFYSRRERDIANRFIKPWRTGAGSYWQAALNWDDIKRYKDIHDLPLILKGIATAEDAELAVEHGVEVVYVSNHGGRQLDHGRGAVDVLPEVVAAVNGRARVWVDGGVARGTDLVKCLILGAEAVGLGRMLCCGLAAGGAEGVIRMLELLEEETRIVLGLLGVTRIADLDASYLTAGDSVDTPSMTSGFPLLADDGFTY